MDPTLLGTLAVPVINFYDRKLIYSGYEHKERLRIIEAGISSYHAKLDSVKEGEEFYRVGKDTLAIRTRKNLLEKMSWYKGKTWNSYMKGKSLVGGTGEQQQDQQNQQPTSNPDSAPSSNSNTEEEDGRPSQSTTHSSHSAQRPTVKGKEGNPKNKGKGMDVLSVMFVQRTKDGSLVDALRKEEQQISEKAGYRVKLVEKAGTKLSQLLTRSDPFGGGDCERPDCLPCGSKAETGKMLPAGELT